VPGAGRPKSVKRAEAWAVGITRLRTPRWRLNVRPACREEDGQRSDSGAPKPSGIAKQGGSRPLCGSWATGRAHGHAGLQKGLADGLGIDVELLADRGAGSSRGVRRNRSFDVVRGQVRGRYSNPAFRTSTMCSASASISSLVISGRPTSSDAWSRAAARGTDRRAFWTSHRRGVAPCLSADFGGVDGSRPSSDLDG
jgi:hypothetical protein